MLSCMVWHRICLALYCIVLHSNALRCIMLPNAVSCLCDMAMHYVTAYHRIAYSCIIVYNRVALCFLLCIESSCFAFCYCVLCSDCVRMHYIVYCCLVLRWSLLRWIVLYRRALNCTVLHCITLHCFSLQRSSLYCVMLCCVILFVLYRIISCRVMLCSVVSNCVVSTCTEKHCIGLYLPARTALDTFDGDIRIQNARQSAASDKKYIVKCLESDWQTKWVVGMAITFSHLLE